MGEGEQLSLVCLLNSYGSGGGLMVIKAANSGGLGGGGGLYGIRTPLWRSILSSLICAHSSHLLLMGGERG